MKRHKFELVFGGICLGVAMAAKPYDFDNIILLGMGILFVGGAWLTMSRNKA